MEQRGRSYAPGSVPTSDLSTLDATSGVKAQLADEDWSQHGEIVQRDPIRCVFREQPLLLLGEELPQRRSPETALCTLRTSSANLSLPEQTKPPGIASTSTPKSRRLRRSAGSSLGTTGRSFTTESSPLPLPWIRRARTTSPC